MATFHYESGIRLNHLSDYQSDKLVTVHNKIFKEFPIYTKNGDEKRLERIFDDAEQEGGEIRLTWEQQQEIDQEFGTTWINLCLN